MAARQQPAASGLALVGTFIGPQIEVRGRMEGEEELRIEGRVEGTIILTEGLRVDQGGVVVANVRAREVYVSGIVIGDIEATERIRLEAGCRVVGNLKAPRVKVSDGAAFSGTVDMGEVTGTEAQWTAKAAGSRGHSSAPRRVATASANPRNSRTAAGSVGRVETPAPRAMPTRSTARTPSGSNVGASRGSVRSSAGRAAGDEGEVTLVVQHSSMRDEATAAENAADAKVRAANASKKKASKVATPRIPSRGKRRVERR